MRWRPICRFSPGHPEGLWARVWELFLELRESAEFERSHLLARRPHDEFWYAEKFRLSWPRLQGSQVSVTGPGIAQAFGAEDPMPSPSPSPSPPPPCDCKVTAVDPATLTLCLGKEKTFTASGENLKDVEWSAPGGTPAEGTGTTFTTKWDSTGSKSVTASCCETSAEAEVSVVKITFDQDPLFTGFTIPATTSAIEVLSFCTCSPAAKAGDVSLVVGGVDRVNVRIINANTTTGRIDFGVRGTLMTPDTKPAGDTTIGAKIDANICSLINVIVVVPYKIYKPYPQANGNVAPQNLALDSTTSPAAWGVPAGNVVLVTAWIQWETITIEDQFGDVLDPLYTGVTVEEDKGGGWNSINQPLTSVGTYRDPVFHFERPTVSIVPAGSPAVAAWVGPGTLAMPKRYRWTQQIHVKVGGHLLVTTINRRVTATPPNHMRVQWP